MQPSLIPGLSGPVVGHGLDVAHFTLANGLEVVVIPDHRAPVVTHMVWYRVGAADEPKAKSGIAHFLEHLMFKGTEKNPGGFSKQVAEAGGQENAFTSYDYTAYFQRVARDQLKGMMAFEADRMAGIKLTDAVVDPERDVVLEERKMRVDNDPGSQLSEEIASALFTHHPYGIPIIGWQDEIEGLDRADALAFHDRFYTPNNAILVVAGDIAADEVLALANETYGEVARRAEPPVRRRPQEPAQRAERRVRLADPRVEQPVFQRQWRVPAYRTGGGGDAAALDLLAQILGGGATSRLYRALVVEQSLAAHAGAWYGGTAVDESRFGVWATPLPGVGFDHLEAVCTEVLETLARDGVTEAELERAKTRMVADAVYAQDSQSTLARHFGSALATGLTVADILAWPERINAVPAEAVQAAARTHLCEARSVTALLDGVQAPAPASTDTSVTP